MYKHILEEERNYFYDNSSLDKAALSTARRKHMRQLAVEATLFPMIHITTLQLCHLADDDKKNKLLQFIAYLMLRTEWESYTAYRFNDLFNTIKTPSAELGTVDKMEAVSNSVFRSVFPNGSLFDTLISSNLKDNKDYNSTIKRGVYKGWKRPERDLFKLTLPFHNFYEQYNDSYSKRKYYQNKIMKAE